MSWKKLLFTFCIYSTVTHAAPHHYQDHYYTQTLNHANQSDKRTFQQRYFFDASAAEGLDSPVILYMGSLCDLDFLLSDSYIPEMARQLHAYFIALEQRYYGKSQPFALLTKHHLSYLNYDNVLQDTAQFQQFIQNSKGLRGKWIVVGHAYGANLAAFYRLQYPNLVAGAIASSPGVRSVAYWPEYDKRAAENAGPDCVSHYRSNVLTPLEDALHDPLAMKKYKDMFSASDIDDKEFISVIGYLSDVMVSKAGPQLFCNSVQSSNAMTAYRDALLTFMHKMSFKFADFTDAGVEDIRASSYEQGMGMRQWTYQFCTEFGGLTISNPDPAVSLNSKVIPEDALAVCRKTFNINSPINPEINNMKYYYPLLSKTTSHIMIVNGTNDPVATLSISDMNGNNVNPNIIVHDIVGGINHSELYQEKITDSDAVKNARRLEIETIKQWLAELKAIHA